MDWSQGALPFGMVFFGIMVLGFLRRKAGHIVARKEYPALAERLGLTYKPSRYRSGVGSLVGHYRGFSVHVDPDDQRRIFLRFRDKPPIELYSYAHNKRPPPGLSSFRPANKKLASVFKTAHGNEHTVRALDEASALEPELSALRRSRELKTLSVTPSGIAAVFDYGNPPFIPAATVEHVLPTLVSLARQFETSEP